MIHHQEYWWRFFPAKELTRVYVSMALRAFALSLISLFIPLYLYAELGYSFDQTIGFFIFYSVVLAITSPLAATFSARYGVKHTILVSVPLYMLFVLLLHLLYYFPISLLLLSALAGASVSFYWMGMHLAFHHASHRNHRGEEVGKRSSATVAGSILGPLVGGIIISLAGFKIVFGLVLVILLLSILVLGGSTENHINYNFSVRSILNRKHWKDSLFFVSRGTHVIAEGVIWPLFVFVILGSYASLGAMGSLLSVVSIALLWSVGKYSDHANKRRIVRVATVFDSLVWIIRGIVTTTGEVFAMTGIAALTHGVRESPLGAMEYDKARGQVAAYFVSREIFVCLGRVLLLTVVLLTNSLSGGLLFQGIINLAALLF